jgi:hypothetical protein
MATQRPNPNQRPQDLAGYAYLFKQLDFPVPFERLREPLDFGGANLESFGMVMNRWPRMFQLSITEAKTVLSSS